MKSFLVNTKIDKYTLIFISITIIGAGLRLYSIQSKSLWQDEQWTVLIARKPDLGHVINYLIRMVDRPPLHLILSHAVNNYICDKDVCLRILSAIFGIISIPAIYCMANTMMDRHPALFAAFLLALNPYQIYYSQEATAYAIFTFISILSILLFYKAVTANLVQYWIWFTVVTTINLYISYFAFLLFASQMIFVGILILVKQGYRDRVKWISISLVIIIVLYTPWLYVLRDVIRRYRGDISSSMMSLSFETIVNLIKAFIVDNSSGVVVISISIFFIYGYYLFYRQNKISFYYLFLITFLPLFLLYLLKPRYSFNPRYVIFISPIFLILTANGIYRIFIVPKGKVEACIPFEIGARSKVISARIGYTLMYLSAVILVISPLYTYFTTEKRDWRSIVEFLSQNASDGDIISMEPLFLYNPFFYYIADDAIDREEKERLIDPLAPLKEPVYIKFGHSHNKKVAVSTFLLLMKPGFLRDYKRLWYILSTEAYPDWVVKGFSLVRSYPGLKGFGSLRLYVKEIKS